MKFHRFLPLICKAWLVAAIRQPKHHDAPVQFQPPVLILGEETVVGYRGLVGTLSILTIAAIVIPAGVVSVLYLMYTHFSVSSEDFFDEQINEESREWRVPEDDFLANTWTWSELDGMSFTFAKQVNDAEAAILEREPLICCDECEDQASFSDDGEIVTNQSVAIDNKGFQNIVEIVVTGDDTKWLETNDNVNDGDSILSNYNEVGGHQPVITFKQEVMMSVVNEFCLELRPEDCLDARRNDDKSFVSEITLHVHSERNPNAR